MYRRIEEESKGMYTTLQSALGDTIDYYFVIGELPEDVGKDTISSHRRRVEATEKGDGLKGGEEEGEEDSDGEETTVLKWEEVGTQGSSLKTLSMDGVIRGYREITGTASLIPRWAFGLWQSKEHYHNQTGTFYAQY